MHINQVVRPELAFGRVSHIVITAQAQTLELYSCVFSQCDSFSCLSLPKSAKRLLWGYELHVGTIFVDK